MLRNSSWNAGSTQADRKAASTSAHAGTSDSGTNRPPNPPNRPDGPGSPMIGGTEGDPPSGVGDVVAPLVTAGSVVMVRPANRRGRGRRSVPDGLRRSWSADRRRAGSCLLYTSDAADEEDSVDLGG